MTKLLLSLTTTTIIWTFLINVFTLSSYTSASRILGIFPHPGHSHFIFFEPIMKGLASAGHDVTVISYFSESKIMKNYTGLKLSGIAELTNSIDLNYFSQRYSHGHIFEFFMLNDWGIEACENILKSSALEKILTTKQPYDILLTENFNSDCTSGIAWKLNVSVIGLTSSALLPWFYDRYGIPQNPSYVPAAFMGYSENMTFKERFGNWISIHILNVMFRLFNEPVIDGLLRKRLDQNMPYIRELSKRSNLIFVNQHYSLSGVKPVSPSVIELGGIHIKKAKPIDKDLLDILNSADHGVIIVSWGSMIRVETLPMEKREQLLQAFATFKKIKFIWKWENDTLQNQPNNVYVRKWLPQRDILCHPKVRVFLTHGGLMGSSEAAYCGVPVVVTPMYGDQFLNAAAFKARNTGKILHYENINKKNIEEAIHYALQDAIYNNAKKLSYSFKNRLNDPLELAIWWVEHIIATGGGDLIRSHSIDMPFYSYHLLDIYLVVFTLFSIGIAGWIILIKYLCRGKSNNLQHKIKKN